VSSTSSTTIVVEPVTLTFEAQGGSGEPDAHTGDSGSTLSVPLVTPTRDGYLFTGWNSEADGSGMEYQPGDPFLLPASGSSVIYAQWVAVNAGGGETATSVPALLPATGVPQEVYSNSLQLAFWSALLGLGVGGLAIAARRKSS
jgi:uncharacterized repeat protein (TIGR02543 family)